MTTANSTHHLTSERVNHRWDNSIPPVIEIDSGDVVVFETRDSSDGRQAPAGTPAALRGPSSRSSRPMSQDATG